MSNAERFIKAYNILDHSLRTQYNFKRSMSFSDLIRKAVSLNSVIRKYEDVLIDYGRLRNAIIHSNHSDQIIAEPVLSVVEHMEKIAKMISTPPFVIDAIKQKEVLCVDAETSLKETIILISESGYSNIPVYDKVHLVGVANGQRLLDVIGNAVKNGIDADMFITDSKIGDIVKKLSLDNYYALKSAKLSIEEAVDLFYKNRKLLVIILSPHGSVNEKPIGIVAVSDIIEINNILDNY